MRCLLFLLQFSGTASSFLQASSSLRNLRRRSRLLENPRSRCPHCSANLPEEDPLPGDGLAAQLRAELHRRDEAGETVGSNLGKFHALERLGPHHTTSPRQVVEHIIAQLQTGNVSQAFAFTAIPVGKRGTHKSSTDWTQRMAWEKASVINGAPSGRFYDMLGFDDMLRSKYASLLDVDLFRFVGDDTPWQQKNGQEKMTDPKDYVVEVKTRKGEHLIISFKLVYDWLVFCHLVASVKVTSLVTSKFFPGAENVDIDI